MQKVVNISVQAAYNPLRAAAAQVLATALLDRQQNYRFKFGDLLRRELNSFTAPVSQTTRRPPRAFEVLLGKYEV